MLDGHATYIEETKTARSTDAISQVAQQVKSSLLQHDNFKHDVSQAKEFFSQKNAQIKEKLRSSDAFGNIFKCWRHHDTNVYQVEDGFSDDLFQDNLEYQLS